MGWKTKLECFGEWHVVGVVAGVDVWMCVCVCGEKSRGSLRKERAEKTRGKNNYLAPPTRNLAMLTVRSSLP